MITIGKFTRPTAAALASFAAISPATLHEALGQEGAMPFAIKPIYPGMKVCGAALTVECRPGDNLAIHAAVETAKPGDVLVVDYKGYLEAGPFGDVLATACQKAGIRGMVIDGCVRDGASLRAMGFPVFGRGLNMKGTTKNQPGKVGLPIICAGVAVAPGDVVVGDDDGVVVVPRGRIAAVVQAAQARDEKEATMREKLKKGATTVELLGLARLLRG
ncbi:4-carboxy-4-hydroxy-2-oxoadipate aldolase/oxaloacetate decarboxylase [soil metagenome]